MAFSFHFPRCSNGQVDWFTLGNIVTGELLGQVHCASYLDSKYGQAKEGFVPETNWEYIGEERNIVIMKRRLEGTRLDSFLGRGVIEFSVQRIAEVIQDMNQIHNWERYLVSLFGPADASPIYMLVSHLLQRTYSLLQDAKYLKVLSENNEDFIAYRRYESTNCLVKTQADFVHYIRSKYHGEKFVRAVVSVEDPSYPEFDGVIRAKMLPGTGFLLEPYNGDPNRTLATYMAGLSLGGLPAIVTNRVIRALPLSIHYLHEYMKKIFAPSPISSGLIDGTSKNPAVVDKFTNPVEKDHPKSGSLNLPQPVSEQHVHVSTHTSPIAACHEGDVPAILMTPTGEESTLYVMGVEIPLNVHISPPQSNPDVRVECTHATDTTAS